MRALLFGASGFIGRGVLTALHGTGMEVIAAGRRVPSPSVDLDPRVSDWVRHDLVTDTPTALDALLAVHRPEVVVNCAGLLNGSIAELAESNVTTVARLIDSCANLGIRLVTLGSAAEYGVVPTGQPVTEDAPCRPLSAYGVTRLAATDLLRTSVAEGRVDGVSLRVFNPIGPGMPLDNVFGRALSQIGGPEIRLGPLSAYRDFIDVRDVGAAIAAAAAVPTLSHAVLNVGSGRAVATRETVGLLCAAAGFTGEIIEAEPPPSRSAGVDWIAADMTRTIAALGWRPEYELGDSVKEMLQA